MDSGTRERVNIMEALKYFKDKRAEFAGNHFSPKEALAFVKSLYKLGCTKVDIDWEYPEDEEPGEIYADAMLITLPKTISKRFDVVLAIWGEYPDEVSADSVYDKPVNWRKDKNVLLWWD